MNLSASQSQDVIGKYLVYPVQPPYPLNGSPEPAFVEGDPSVYLSASPYPGKMIEYKDVGAIAEYKIVEITIYPLQYIPVEQKLILYHSISFDVEYNTGTYPVPIVARRSEFSQKAIENHILSLIDNKNDFYSFTKANAAKTYKITGMAGQEITPAPSINGQPVDYVIITTDGLANEFQRLADWKNKKGIVTVIKTVEWIKQNYEGLDTQEKIRNFIKTCFLNWGTMFVLIGGDVEQVPIRYTVYDASGYIPENRLPIDLYYSDVVDGKYAQSFWSYNYNANQNAIIGEAAPTTDVDKIDQKSDIFLGRAPVTNKTEVHTFIDKIQYYEKEELPVGYAASFLLMGFGEPLEQVNSYQIVPDAPWINTYELYTPMDGGAAWQADDNLNNITAFRELNNGYNLVHHVDHGAVYALSTAKEVNDSWWLYRSDADNLNNIKKPSIILTLACSPNAYDHNCFSRRIMNNDNGGAVAFIGNTRVGWFTQNGQFVELITQRLHYHDYYLGSLFSIAQINGDYYTRYSVALLGDPTMLVWSHEQDAYNPVHQTTLVLSDSLITVDIPNSHAEPLLAAENKALICLQKPGEIYEVKEISVPGSYTFKVKPQTLGDIDITITGPNFKTYESVCSVTPSVQAHPCVTNYMCFDDSVGLYDLSSGNHDFMLNPGEQIALYTDIINNGGTDLGALRMALRTNNPNITLIDSVRYLSELIRGQQINADTLTGGAFLFIVSPNAVSGDTVSFNVNFTSTLFPPDVIVSEGTMVPIRRLWDQSIKMTILADSLQHKFNKRTGNISVNQIITLDSLLINNYGVGGARGVNITIRTVGIEPDAVSVIQYLQVVDGSSYVGEIKGKESVYSTDPLSVKILKSSADPANYELIMKVSDYYGRFWEKEIQLAAVPSFLDQPLSVVGNSSSSMKISWGIPASMNITGYNIYRKNSATNTFERVNEILVEGSRVYVDIGLQQNTYYEYDVTVVDCNGNESPLDGYPNPAIGKTQPGQADGLPLGMGIGGNGMQMWATPAVADINCDGYKEIVMGCDDGKVYAIDKNGQDLLGWPIDFGVQIDNSSPAIVDIDNDGFLEIIMGTGSWLGSPGDNSSKVHVLRYDGSEQPGWPQLMYGDAFASCVAADINCDGSYEIIAGTKTGYVYVWDKTGNLLWVPYFAGWFDALGAYIGATPAVGNLDNDPELEIVVCSRSYNGTANSFVL